MSANTSFSGTTDDTLEFERPVNYLNIGVASGVTFSFSIDGSVYIPVPPGLYGISIGATKMIFVSSDGSWGINGVQA